MSSIRDWFIIGVLGAFGGVVRAALTSEGSISLGVFIVEAVIGAFVAVIAGLLLTSWSSYSIEVVYALCGLAGIMARDLIPLFIKKMNQKLNQRLKEK